MKLTALALLLSVSPATAGTVVIDGDKGGWLHKYQELFNEVSSDQIVIDGECMSACTIFLAAPKVCVTESAVLGFHKPFRVIRETKQIAKGDAFVKMANDGWQTSFYNIMPDGVKALLNTAPRIPSPTEGDAIGDMFRIKGRDLKGAIPMCPDNWKERLTDAE